MARNTSITLGDHFDSFVVNQVERGRYGSASEVIRAGLRLLEDSDAKLLALRKALADGEASGFTDYSFDALLSELDEEAQISG